MLRIEGHFSRNLHLILNLGRKRAIKSVSERKRKIPHTVFGVVQSCIRTENLEAKFRPCMALQETASQVSPYNIATLSSFCFVWKT